MGGGPGSSSLVGMGPSRLAPRMPMLMKYPGVTTPMPPLSDSEGKGRYIRPAGNPESRAGSRVKTPATWPGRGFDPDVPNCEAKDAWPVVPAGVHGS